MPGRRHDDHPHQTRRRPGHHNRSVSQNHQLSPHCTPPVRLSLSLRRLLVSQFGASDLRHLASLMEAESPGLVARSRLDDASVEELAEMLTSGRKPTLGWWRRHSEAAA